MKYNVTNAKKVLQALITAGAKPAVIPFLMAQVAHETGDFDSNVFNSDNNASGIIYIGKPSKQINATRGTRRKASEGGNYAKFATLTDWARDYLRIIGTAPAKASNVTEYAKLLKARGYYTDTVENYTSALVGHIKELTSQGLTNPPKGTGVAVMALVILAILFFTI
jgi:hypothetical protein